MSIKKQLLEDQAGTSKCLDLQRSKIWHQMLLTYFLEINIEVCVQESIKIFCNTPKSAAYRQHARPSKKKTKPESRPNLSYYSRDYNDQPANDLVCIV